jgi:hypothetical protein
MLPALRRAVELPAVGMGKAVMNAGSLQPQQALGGHRMAAGSAIDRARRAHL